MTYYAIRHNPTGLFLPQRKGCRGFTYDEPSDGVPRLFDSIGAAKHALRWWLMGVTSVSRWDGDEDWHTSPRPHRDPSTMEIVPVELAMGETLTALPDIHGVLFRALMKAEMRVVDSEGFPEDENDLTGGHLAMTIQMSNRPTLRTHEKARAEVRLFEMAEHIMQRSR